MIQPSAGIAGMGFALPEHHASQESFTEFIIQTLDPPKDDVEFLRVVARRAGVDRRGAVFLDASADAGAPVAQRFYRRAAEGSIPTTAERMAAYAQWAPPLAIAAAREALREAKPLGCGSPTGITHLVTFSCTGFGAPGVDASVIRALELHSDVQRVNIGFMGCHAAINAMRVGKAIVEASPAACVLLVGVEVCSLHLIYGRRRDQLIASCLFGDGAAAVVMTGAEGAPIRIVDTASALFPGSAGAMHWTVGDHGFEMGLSEDVPALIATHIGPWIDRWLARAGVDAEVMRTEALWCVHPGGPRVLHAVAEAMNLPSGAMHDSRAVLRDHGNMSSVTTLFILDRLRRAHATSGSAELRRVIALGFGPGLAGEAALIELGPPQASP